MGFWEEWWKKGSTSPPRTQLRKNFIIFQGQLTSQFTSCCRSLLILGECNQGSHHSAAQQSRFQDIFISFLLLPCTGNCLLHLVEIFFTGDSRAATVALSPHAIYQTLSFCRSLIISVFFNSWQAQTEPEHPHHCSTLNFSEILIQFINILFACYSVFPCASRSRCTPSFVPNGTFPAQIPLLTGTI